MTTMRANTLAAVVALAAGSCVPALAVDKFWSLAGSGNVSIGANWAPAGVPLTTDDWIFSQPLTYTVTFDGPAPDSSNSLSFRDAATVTVRNPSVPHVTDEFRVGTLAGPLSVAILDGEFRTPSLALASILAGGQGSLSIFNPGTRFVMEDNGLIRIADNVGATATLTIGVGTTLTEVSDPSGDVDTGSIVVGTDGAINVSGTVDLDEWDLDMSAGGTLALSNGASVSVSDLILGPGSLISGSGSINWITIDADPAALVQNVGVLDVLDPLLSEVPGTYRVNPGQLNLPDVLVLFNGLGGVANTINMNGGTLTVGGPASIFGIGEIENSSNGTISGFGTIDADIDNNGTITPSGAGLILLRKLIGDGGTINGTTITLAPTGAFEGSGSMLAGLTANAGSTITLTGDADFGTFGAAPPLGINMSGKIFLGGFTGYFRDSGIIDFAAAVNLQSGVLRVDNGGNITPTGELNGPGTLRGNFGSTGLVSTDGPILQSTGSTNLAAGNDLRLIMRGAAPLDFGSYRVAGPGTITLNGSLEVVLRPEFDYVTGDEFTLIEAPAGRAGTFGAITYTNPRNGALFNLIYNATSVRLRVLRGGCDTIDFNNNSVFPEDQDVIDFFDVLAGGTPATCDPVLGCNTIDFNNNGVFPEDKDVIDFFTVLAGGPCI